MNNNEVVSHLCIKCKRELFFENGILGEWLDSKEAASFLGISPNALRILVHRGKVEAHKIGRRLRFRRSSIRSLLKRREL